MLLTLTFHLIYYYTLATSIVGEGYLSLFVVFVVVSGVVLVVVFRPLLLILTVILEFSLT